MPLEESLRPFLHPAIPASELHAYLGMEAAGIVDVSCQMDKSQMAND
jgi:hypothetical protein